MLQSELKAAAAGGVTSLVCPPDTDPPLDEPGLVEMLKFRARQLSSCRLFPLGALTRGLQGDALTEMAHLSEAGCVGFSQADHPVRDTNLLMRALQYAATFGHTVWLRPQDAWLGTGVAASGARGHAAGPVRRAGGRRDGGAAHHLRAGARHRCARAPVPPEQRRRRRAGAARQGRRAAGHRRRQRAVAAPDRCRHRLLQRRHAPEPAAAPAGRSRRVARARWPTARSTRWCPTTTRWPTTPRTCRSPRPSPARARSSCC